MSETVNEQFRGREGILSVKEGNSEEKGHSRRTTKRWKGMKDNGNAAWIRAYSNDGEIEARHVECVNSHVTAPMSFVVSLAL